MARLGELHPSGVLWPDAERVAMSLFRGPGVCILSTVPRELDTSGAPADGYATYSGTSIGLAACRRRCGASGQQDNPYTASDVQLIRSTILERGQLRLDRRLR
ncbi:MAG: hypothetical protein M3N57_05055 [Actinomycetota bacterium]|nr:hypothetical protein [Actinomycetota bacterium]